MWVRVPDWMIADEEVPIPRPGIVLRHLGIRWRGDVTSAPSEVPIGIEPLPDTGEAACRVTGLAGDAREFEVVIDHEKRRRGTDFVLSVGKDRFQVPFWGESADVSAGSRVSVRGRAEIIGGYEWDAFDLGDVRADWQVLTVTPPAANGVLVDLSPRASMLD